MKWRKLVQIVCIIIFLYNYTQVNSELVVVSNLKLVTDRSNNSETYFDYKMSLNWSNVQFFIIYYQISLQCQKTMYRLLIDLMSVLVCDAEERQTGPLLPALIILSHWLQKYIVLDEEEGISQGLVIVQSLTINQVNNNSLGL